MMHEMTARQSEVLTYIVGCIQRDGYPPTFREIMEHFAWRSPRAVSDHLEALERKGYLRLVGTARGIQLAEGVMPNEEVFPVLGYVGAGKAILAEENIVGTFSMAQEFGRGGSIFVLRVAGECLKDMGIFHGDRVVVRRQPEVGQGELAVAVTEEGLTVKRIFVEQERIRLQPENAEMQPTYVAKSDANFRIAGKVVGVVRKF